MHMEHINKLTYNELLELREQIPLHALSINNCKNDLAIPPQEVIRFFEEYVEYLKNLATNDIYGNTTADDWDLFDSIVNYIEYFEKSKFTSIC